jgi:hypothetical protein
MEIDERPDSSRDKNSNDDKGMVGICSGATTSPEHLLKLRDEPDIFAYKDELPRTHTARDYCLYLPNPTSYTISRMEHLATRAESPLTSANLASVHTSLHHVHDLTNNVEAYLCSDPRFTDEVPIPPELTLRAVTPYSQTKKTTTAIL